MNLVYQMLERGLRRNPDKTLFVFDDGEYTYRDFERRVDKLCHALSAKGVQPGDRVSYYMANKLEALVTFWASFKMGTILVPASVLLRPRDLSYTVNNAESKVLVVDASDANVMDSLSACRSQLETVDVVLACRGELPGAESWDAAVEAQDWEPFPIADCDEDQIGAIYYTSGTTGVMKGCMMTHGNISYMVQTYVHAFKFRQGDVSIHSMPIYYAFSPILGIMPTVQMGGTVVLHEIFNPERMLDGINRHKATFFCGVPTMYSMMLEAWRQNPEKYDATSLRVCASSGSKLAPELMQNFEKALGCTIGEVYGLSEGGPIWVQTIPGLRRPGSTGLPAANLDVKIFDDNDNELPPGQMGEIVIRGSQCCQGYWKMPEMTQELYRSGWLHTGDLGYIDEDGYGYVVDRKKDMIITGGANIYPAEVENVLYSHPAVLLAAVVGVPDDTYGELPKAFIVLKEGAHATAEEIIAYCRDQMAKNKAPRMVEFVIEMPMTANRKILRRTLREQERAKQREVKGA